MNRADETDGLTLRDQRSSGKLRHKPRARAHRESRDDAVQIEHRLGEVRDVGRVAVERRDVVVVDEPRLLAQRERVETLPAQYGRNSSLLAYVLVSTRIRSR